MSVSGKTWLKRMKMCDNAGRNNSLQGIKLTMICQFMLKRGGKERK